MTVEYQRLPDNFVGDFEALKTPEGWVKEAMRLHLMGFARAGVLGFSCPRCWRVVSPLRDEQPHPAQCQCEDREPHDAAPALGLVVGPRRIQRHQGPVGL